MLGAQLIQLGRAEVVVAAGTESMTRAPLVSAYDDGTRSYGEPRPSLMTDALEDAFTGTPMGLTAEEVSQRWGVDRASQDAWALVSQQRAAAATEEIELSRQSGLSVTGNHLDSALGRAQAAVAAVQSGLAKRLSGGQQFLASVGSIGPFVGLFGTVYGIMNSFIGIAESNTTNLAVVAPGIAEALLATGIGLFAAIPAVIFYNYFNTRISNYGTRSDGFNAELMNSISRQLDKGA